MCCITHLCCQVLTNAQFCVVHSNQGRSCTLAASVSAAQARISSCADEQGLGKTVQMLALIVSKGPTAAEAHKALEDAKRSQRNMELHPLGSAARAARAAELGMSPNALPGSPWTSGAFIVFCSIGMMAVPMCKSHASEC